MFKSSKAQGQKNIASGFMPDENLTPARGGIFNLTLSLERRGDMRDEPLG
jgi:hypothetical protein